MTQPQNKQTTLSRTAKQYERFLKGEKFQVKDCSDIYCYKNKAIYRKVTGTKYNQLILNEIQLTETMAVFVGRIFGQYIHAQFHYMDLNFLN